MQVRTHGIGGAKDLPIPLELAISGAVAALVVSFVILALAWRRSRYDPPRTGRPVPAPVARAIDSPGFAWALRVAGLAFAGWGGFAAFAGPDLDRNPVFGMVYVLLWVGLVPASLLFGPAYRALSPVRTLNILLARATGADPDRGSMRLPDALGYWPAAFFLLAFAWQELVNPAGVTLAWVRLWFSLYVAIMLVGAALYGSRWLERADPFEVYSTLVGHLSPWGRDDSGRLVVRSPLANLATAPLGPGLVGVAGVLLGSTAFDSLSETTWFLAATQSALDSRTLIETATLVVMCALVTGLVAAATAAARPRADLGRGRASLPSYFSPSLVPIIVGYIVAHYLTLLTVTGVETVAFMSDPLVRGDDLLGTGSVRPTFWLSYHPTVLASVKVGAVVLGHVIGVIAAHDRALSVLDRRHATVGQLPLLAAMVVITVGGLALLLAV